jgi:hypothetical protein
MGAVGVAVKPEERGELSAEDVTRDERPVSRRELYLVAGLIVVFLTINLATAARYPTVWMDEVMFCDPAINFATGRGLTSTAWFAQTKDAFWAGYPPLYQLALALWVKFFGQDLATLRALNYLLMTIASLMTWLSVIRLRLVTSAYWRVALLSLFLFSFGVSFCYRVARPDCLAICSAALALLAYTLPSRLVRWVLMFVAGLLCTLVGMQMLAVAVPLTALLLLYLRRAFLYEAVALWAGLLAGLGVLYGLYSYLHVWPAFVNSVLGWTTFGSLQRVTAGTFSLQNRLPRDYSLWLLALLAAGLFLRRLRRGEFRLISPLSFGLVASVCMPAWMFLAGKFPTYYSWMLYLPLAVCVCAEAARGGLSRSARVAVTAALLLVCACGLPLQLASTAYDWAERDYAPVERLVAAHVGGETWVYCDYPAYFAAKATGAVVITPFYLFAAGGGQKRRPVIPTEEKTRVSVMVIDPDDFGRVSGELGGAWVAVGEALSPRKGGLFGLKMDLGVLTLKKYRLQVYKKLAP